MPAPGGDGRDVVQLQDLCGRRFVYPCRVANLVPVLAAPGSHVPFRSNARLCRPPAEIAVTSCRSTTATGGEYTFADLEPTPRWPSLSAPHARTVPSGIRAR